MSETCFSIFFTITLLIHKNCQVELMTSQLRTVTLFRIFSMLLQT